MDFRGKAESINELRSSVEGGRFTLDGRHLFAGVASGGWLDDLGLTSLVGCPLNISASLFVSRNLLTDLVGAPVAVSSMLVENNCLTSLEGAPKHCKINFNTSNNRLTSLHNIHNHIYYIGAMAVFNDNPIKSHVLGLLKIKELKEVAFDDRELEKILNKHLKGSRDILDCAEELVENGLDAFAQL